jgi:hypothetical protein
MIWLILGICVTKNSTIVTVKAYETKKACERYLKDFESRTSSCQSHNVKCYIPEVEK